MQDLHDQNVKLRSSFLREDPRITGTIPRHLMPATFKAGGMELRPEQLEDARKRFMTGDGRFNWMVFCDQVEKARKQSWGEASRIKSAKLFNELDRDGSGRLGREELTAAVNKLGIKVQKSELETMFDSFDEDGDGNLSYPEFVDGFATNMIAPCPVFQRVLGSSRGPKKLGGISSNGKGPMSPRF